MMSQARFKRIESGLTNTAKKVYAAVPMSESWSAQSIVAELKRSGVTHDFAIIVGCLNSLIQAGVVREPAKGMFMREPIRASTPKPARAPARSASAMRAALGDALEDAAAFAPAPPAPPAPPTPSPLPYTEALALMKPTTTLAKLSAHSTTNATHPSGSALDKLAVLSTRINGLAGTLRTIGDELADLAVEIEQEREAKDEDLGKLKQLQQLLKSLG